MNKYFINIVIPMAGKGERFYAAGYKLPKPFIDMHGKMMIERVLDNLSYPKVRYLLIARKEHMQQYKNKIEQITEKYNIEFITINNLTYGAACTTLAAHRYINDDKPLLIANSDQIIDLSLSCFIDDSFAKEFDGSILTFKNSHPKWSYAKIDKHDFVVEVKEKKPISCNATVGIYFFNHGKDYINGVVDMISQHDVTNNEFYVAPVYNYLIKQGNKIGIYEIDEKQMHGLGTPEDFKEYMIKYC